MKRPLDIYKFRFTQFSKDQIFLSLIPFGVSSMTQPLAFNSSRIASDFLKSRFFLASTRAFAKARISVGISTSVLIPTPRTESTFSHAANFTAAAFARSNLKLVKRSKDSEDVSVVNVSACSCTSYQRLVSRTHSNTAAHARDIFRSSSSAVENFEIK